MTGGVVELRGERVMVQARLSGRATYAIHIYDCALGAEPRLVHLDVQNPSSQRGRDALAAAVDEPLRSELRDLLMQLGAQIDQLRASETGATSREDARNDATRDEALMPAEDAVDGATLLTTIRDMILRYVVLPPHAAEALALWCLHTYAIEAAPFTPYIWVSSPVRECGKSSLLEVLGALGCRARTSGGVSPAALYRMIEQRRPTMLLDELDTYLHSDRGEELRNILNSGFARTGRVTRCDGENNDIRDFSTFCPKVLAGIGRLWETVASRAIPIPMVRATAAERQALARVRSDRLAPSCEHLRRQMLRWARDHIETLRDADPDVPGRLGARQADIWRPLLAIADLAGDAWSVQARDAALALHGAAADDEDINEMLLADIRAAFEAEGTEMIFSERLAAELAQLEYRPWGDWRGKALSPHGLGRLLKAFKIRPKNLRLGTEVKRGYERGQFEQVWAQYLPPQTATAATPLRDNGLGGFQTATCVEPVADAESHNSLSSRVVAVVALAETDTDNDSRPDAGRSVRGGTGGTSEPPPRSRAEATAHRRAAIAIPQTATTRRPPLRREVIR